MTTDVSRLAPSTTTNYDHGRFISHHGSKSTKSFHNTIEHKQELKKEREDIMSRVEELEKKYHLESYKKQLKS